MIDPTKKRTISIYADKDVADEIERKANKMGLSISAFLYPVIQNVATNRIKVSIASPTVEIEAA